MKGPPTEAGFSLFVLIFLCFFQLFFQLCFLQLLDGEVDHFDRFLNLDYGLDRCLRNLTGSRDGLSPA